IAMSTPPEPGEPSIEQILASIRQIITDGRAPKPQAVVASKTEPSPTEPTQSPAEEPLVLTQAVAEEGAVITLAAGEIGQGDILAVEEPLLLTETLPAPVPPAPTVPPPSRTLEEMILEALEPKLAAWLDRRLGEIVERRVREEIDRIARKP